MKYITFFVAAAILLFGTMGVQAGKDGTPTSDLGQAGMMILTLPGHYRMPERLTSIAEQLCKVMQPPNSGWL